MRVRTVTLELLRHGPSHNQLLSPLTPYLALCGDHGAETVHLPMEHWEYLSKVRPLNEYGPPGDDEARRLALREVARLMTRLLGSIEALKIELASAGPDELVHVRLVLSASELASLPFELAGGLSVAAAESPHLLLRSARPVVVTRASRRDEPEPPRWPVRPTILFAFASPPGLPPVPYDAHLLALRRALHPWLGWLGEQKRLEELGTHLRILPNATLTQIEEACEKTQFTHVHLLAHGVELPEPLGQARYGLALMPQRPSEGGFDAVSGKRLEQALCPKVGGRRPPTVVSLAACESGRGGSVVLPGGSLAHELHSAGIPLVVGSQFPLTYEGSAVLADRVYEGLLRGEDPRELLFGLRADLHQKCPDTHDWASVVAYATLPAALEASLRRVARQRARKALDVVVGRVREAETEEEQAAEYPYLDAAFDRVKALLAAPGATRGGRARVHGWLASVALRFADHRRLPAEPRAEAGAGGAGAVAAGGAGAAAGSRRAGGARGGQPYPKRFSALEFDELLRLARSHYRSAFLLERRHWSLQMVLLLDVRLGGRCDAGDWLTARALAQAELEAREGGGPCEGGGRARRESIASAHDTLAQLWLLAGAAAPSPRDAAFAEAKAWAPPTLAFAEARAREHLEAVLKVAGHDSFQAFTVARQMKRMGQWLPNAPRHEGLPEGWRPQKIAAAACELRRFLVEEEKVAERWDET
ncbi:MAG TPA: CHAT domain-containing protein [Polyangiaceae bacterium]|nr:CHAT domain-containing protein [Polyangiaceae bacterium]